jgi:dihydrofolate synthase/folylpolyglutamate synthase
VITRIDFDHENYLGHSLEEIAREKAGIVKAGVPVATAPQLPEVREVLRGKARELDATIVDTGEDFDLERENAEAGCARALARARARGEAVRLAPGLPGRFQLENALNALATARLLQARGYRITNQNIEQGIRSAEWPGRLERLQAGPDVYLDGAHNPGAARELAQFLEENFRRRRVYLIFGAMRDKSVDEVTGILFPLASEVIFTQPGTPRAVSANQLADLAGHHAARYTVIRDAEEALESALAKARSDDAVFVTGSLYLVGQLRHAWKGRGKVASD